MIRPAIPAAFAAALFLAGCNEQKSPPAQPAAAPPPPAIGFTVVQPQTVNITTELAGRVVPSLIAEVRPQVSGIIERRLFTEGSEVKEGDVLYQIAAASYQASQASAQAALDRARAAQVAAQSRADRYKELASRRIASEQDTESAIATAQQAVADVAAAKASLDAANINLDHTKVRAPISGRIGVSTLTEGALVTASQPTPLATVQALDPVFVDAPQSATAVLATRADIEAGRMQAPPGGIKMRLFLDNGQPYAQEGVLKFTDVTVNQGTGTVTLRATFANPDRILLPNMFVRGIAALATKNNALVVPQRAVTRDPRGQANAYVIGEGNRIEARQLSITHSDGNNWIVDSGLKPGDRVVMDGFQRIRPGAVVTPTPFQPATAANTPATPAK